MVSRLLLAVVVSILALFTSAAGTNRVAEAAGCPSGQTPSLKFSLDNKGPDGKLLDPPGILKLFCDSTQVASWRVSSGDNVAANDSKKGGPLPRGTWTLYKRTVRHPDANCKDRSPGAPPADQKDWYPLFGVATSRNCFYIHGSKGTGDVAQWKASSKGCLAIEPTKYAQFKNTIDQYFPAGGTMSLVADYSGSLSLPGGSDHTVNQTDFYEEEECDTCEDGTCSVGGIADLPDLAGASRVDAGASTASPGWPPGAYAGLTGGLAAALALLAAAAWYSTRRWRHG